MPTEYTHTATIACPESDMINANHLALIIGESAGDINTFTTASYTDGTANYAVAHTVCKEFVLQAAQQTELPPTPPHAEDILDRDKALVAFATINQPGGILLAFDVNPHEQLAQWGLSRIQTEDELA